MTIETTITTAIEPGSDGQYVIGYEHTAWSSGPRAVLRPVERRVHLGYGLDAHGTAYAVTAIVQDGPMTPWRTGPKGGLLLPCERPISPPVLHLPDEDWGPDLVPPTEPVRYEHVGRQIDEGAARELILAYIATLPEWQRQWERDRMEREWGAARREGVLP